MCHVSRVTGDWSPYSPAGSQLLAKVKAASSSTPVQVEYPRSSCYENVCIGTVMITWAGNEPSLRLKFYNTGEGHYDVLGPWNNGKSGAKLDLTGSTTPGLQIHTVDHTFQLLRDSFSVSQQPPIWEPPSHYSMTRAFSWLKALSHLKTLLSIEAYC